MFAPSRKSSTTGILGAFFLLLLVLFPAITHGETPALTQAGLDSSALTAARQACTAAQQKAQETGSAEDQAAAQQKCADADAAEAEARDSANTAATNGGGGSSECGFFSNWGQCIVDAIGGAILLVSSAFLGIAGLFLNVVIVNTVFRFSEIIGNSPGLLLAWSILRDLANLALLFGFILIGVSTILELKTFTVKKALPRLIIFAVLMNFSLFVTEAVIDVSNVLSANVYAQASGVPECLSPDVSRPEGETAGQAQQSITDCTNFGIGGNIMTLSGLSTIYSPADNVEGALPFSAYIGLSVFAIVGAVVMLAAGIMLVVRAVSLTFLMVTAPLGFAALAIPPLQKTGEKWWHALLSQAFFAPLLLIFILISLKIAESFGTVGGDGLAGALSQPNASTFSIFLVFALLIGFLIASIISAKKMGAVGAGFAVNSAAKVTFGTANLATSGSARYARRAIQRSSFADSGAARMFSNLVLSPVERGKLDMRRIPGAGKALSAAGAGEGAKPRDTLGETQEKYTNFVERMEKSRKKYDSEVKKEKIKKKIKQRVDLNAEDKAFLSGLSTKELEEMKGIRDGVEKLVENLSPEQFENLMKSDKLTDVAKGRISAARFARISESSLTHAEDTARQAAVAAGRNFTADDALKARQDAAREVLKKMSNSELESLPAGMLDPNTAHGRVILAALSDPQRDHLAGSKKRTNEERAHVKASTANARLEDTFRTQGAAAAAALVSSLTPAQVAKLDKNILKAPEIAQQLTASQLKELQGKLNGADTLTIAGHINRGGTPGAQAYIGPGGVGSAYWS